jgi:hypothetical protein
MDPDPQHCRVVFLIVIETPPYVEQCRLTLVTIVLLKMPQPMEVDMPLFVYPLDDRGGRSYGFGRDDRGGRDDRYGGDRDRWVCSFTYLNT